ncbi:hypothetical protein BH20GEM1_BH20GEM1_06650 [soil metagenome]
MVALLLGALACGPEDSDARADAPVVKADLGERFELALGERADVAGFRVAFVRVAEDLRCPEAVLCAQDGNAAVAFAVKSEAGSATLTLHTDREPRAAAAMGHALRLVELRPRPAEGVLRHSTNYQATLIVEPAP